MTATLLGHGTVPVVDATAGVGSLPPAVAPSRDYFPNVTASTVAPYAAMVGQLSPTPDESLAQVVRAVAA